MISYCYCLHLSHISQVKSEKFSRVSLVGNTRPVRLSSQVFTTNRKAKKYMLMHNTSSVFPPGYLLRDALGTLKSIKFTSPLWPTRDCGDMRNAKDQQEPPLPSPGIEEQQKGHQTKGGPSMSQ